MQTGESASAMLAKPPTEGPRVRLVATDHAAAAECLTCGSWWHVADTGGLRCPLGCNGVEEGDHAKEGA